MISSKDYFNLLVRKLPIVVIGLILVISSNFIGHFLPPFSIFITPVILPVIIGVINYSYYKRNYYLTVLYGFGLLFLNDILIRLYAGGDHDDEGKAWIQLFFMLAFTLCFFIMLLYAGNVNDVNTKREKIIMVLKRIVFLLVWACLAGFFYSKYMLKI